MPAGNGTRTTCSSPRGGAGANVRKILFISNEAARTGAPAILLGLIHWFQDHDKLEIVNVLMRDGALRSDFELTGKTYTWSPPDLNRPDRLHKRLANVILQRHRSDPGAWLTRILDKEKPDVIYLSTLVLGKYLQAFSKRPGQVVVSHGHELLPSLRQLSTDSLVLAQLALSDVVIACADCVQDMLTQRYQLAASRCKVIPEFVSVPQAGGSRSAPPGQEPPLPAEAMAPAERSAVQTLKAALRDGAHVFGIGGNPINRKGFDLLPLLVLECRRRFRDTPFHVVWIGCGEGSPAQVALEWDLERMGLEGCVSLLPSVSMPTFRWCLSRLRVLTLLSREDPFPLVVLEAGLLGVPTVCFDGSGAIPELARDGCCISVPYLDLAAFAEAVHRLCLDPGEAKAIALRCARKVNDELSLNTVAPLVAEVLLGPIPSRQASQA